MSILTIPYTTLAKVKSSQYCNLVGNNADNSFDDELTTLIADVSSRAEKYLDRASAYVDITEIPAAVNDAVAKQVTYEYRRRKDLGLQSTSFPDGSINKYDQGDWLKGVEQTLQRYKRYVIR